MKELKLKKCLKCGALIKVIEDCHCEKYVPTDGKAKQEKKYSIYFPNKENKRCDKCDRDVFIKKY